jgi:hypothetical protein
MNSINTQNKSNFFCKIYICIAFSTFVYSPSLQKNQSIKIDVWMKVVKYSKMKTNFQWRKVMWMKFLKHGRVPN